MQQRRRDALRAPRPSRPRARSACACPRAPGDGARRRSPAGSESARASVRRRDPTGSGCRSPPPTASLARRHSSRRSPASSPAPPFSGSNSIGSVVERNGESGGRCRSFATCSLCDDRVLDLNLAARLGLRLQQIALGPDRRAHRRHELFANRVERRVRHLREQLLEIVVEQPRLVRQAPPATCRCPSSRPAPAPLIAIGASSTRRSSCV